PWTWNSDRLSFQILDLARLQRTKQRSRPFRQSEKRHYVAAVGGKRKNGVIIRRDHIGVAGQQRFHHLRETLEVLGLHRYGFSLVESLPNREMMAIGFRKCYQPDAPIALSARQYARGKGEPMAAGHSTKAYQYGSC